MPASPRKRRAVLTLGQLKGRLSAGIEYATKLLEDETADHDVRLRGLTALVQASATYAKLVELYDLERDVREIELLTPRNGHQIA
jgi:hypothetical protein